MEYADWGIGYAGRDVDMGCGDISIYIVYIVYIYRRYVIYGDGV